MLQSLSLRASYNVSSRFSDRKFAPIIPLIAVFWRILFTLPNRNGFTQALSGCNSFIPFWLARLSGLARENTENIISRMCKYAKVYFAGVAQWLELHVANVNVVGSNPITRSFSIVADKPDVLSPKATATGPTTLFA